MPTEDNDLNSLSRSSSLLQFETLEKQCQETRSNSPSIYSQFSFDSLEVNNRNNNFSPDSLNYLKSAEEETELCKTVKISVPSNYQKRRDDFSYNVTKLTGTDSSESAVTSDTPRSSENFKAWRSFDSLPICKNNAIKDKVSVENLSEDSGYSDHMTKSYSSNDLKDGTEVQVRTTMQYNWEKSSFGFTAYDGDLVHEVSLTLILLINQKL